MRVQITDYKLEIIINKCYMAEEEKTHDRRGDAREYTRVGPPSPKGAESVVQRTTAVENASKAVENQVREATQTPQAMLPERALSPVVESLQGRATADELSKPENGWLRDLEFDVPTDGEENEITLAPHSFARCRFNAGVVSIGDGFEVKFSNVGTPTWALNGSDLSNGYVFEVGGVTIELVTEGRFGYLVLSNQGDSDQTVNLKNIKNNKGELNIPDMSSRLPAENMSLLKGLAKKGINYGLKRQKLLSRLLGRGAPNAVNLGKEEGCRVNVPEGQTLILGEDQVKITPSGETVNVVLGNNTFVLSPNKAVQCGSVVFGYEKNDSGYLFYVANESGKDGLPVSVKIDGQKIEVV